VRLWDELAPCRNLLVQKINAGAVYNQAGNQSEVSQLGPGIDWQDRYTRFIKCQEMSDQHTVCPVRVTSQRSSGTQNNVEGPGYVVQFASHRGFNSFQGSPPKASRDFYF